MKKRLEEARKKAKPISDEEQVLKVYEKEIKLLEEQEKLENLSERIETNKMERAALAEKILDAESRYKVAEQKYKESLEAKKAGKPVDSNDFLSTFTNLYPSASVPTPTPSVPPPTVYKEAPGLKPATIAPASDAKYQAKIISGGK